MIFHKQTFDVQFGARSLIIGTGTNFIRICEANSDISDDHTPSIEDVNPLAPTINLMFPNAASMEPLIDSLLKLKDKLTRQEVAQQITNFMEMELTKQTEEDGCCGCGDPDCDNETSLAGDEEPT